MIRRVAAVVGAAALVLAVVLPAAVQSLAAASTGPKAGSAEGTPESLDLRVQGDFSRWREKVLVAPPKAFQPLSRLRAALAAFGSAH